mgnify:FL=1
MGADLYIEGVAGDDGYFRDAYNAGNVLWTLGLSWWQDVNPMLDSEGKLTGDKLEKFRDMVANAEQRYPTKSELVVRGGKIDTGSNTVVSWHKYFANKRQELLDYLNRAVEMKKPIRCSL